MKEGEGGRREEKCTVCERITTCGSRGSRVCSDEDREGAEKGKEGEEEVHDLVRAGFSCSSSFYSFLDEKKGGKNVSGAFLLSERKVKK